MPDKKKKEIDWEAINVKADASKVAISIRVDSEVLDFFKSQGKGYQTKINDVLRSFVNSHKD